MSGRQKARATKLHLALYIAAEQADELCNDSEPLRNGDKVLRQIADAIYFHDEVAMRKILKQYGATALEVATD